MLVIHGDPQGVIFVDADDAYELALPLLGGGFRRALGVSSAAIADPRKDENPVLAGFSLDAPGMIRTCDLCLRRAALYPLSYGRSGGQCSRASAPATLSSASSGTSTRT